MKPTLLLLHGALGSRTTMEALAEAARPHFEPFLCEFKGHGATPADGALRMTALAEEVKDFVKRAEAESIFIFGYSMGGYAALLAASEGLEVNGIITYGTRLDWNPIFAEKEASRLVPEVMEAKVPAFTQGLAKLHTVRPWQELVRETAYLLHELDREDYLQLDARLKCIPIPVLFLQGEEDRTLQPEEYALAAGVMPRAVVRKLAGQPHPQEKVDVGMIVKELRNFETRVGEKSE